MKHAVTTLFALALSGAQAIADPSTDYLNPSVLWKREGKKFRTLISKT